MKFEELLIMQESEEKQKRMDLQQEVDQLEVELEEELRLSKILRYALDGSIHSCPCWFSPLPFKIKELLIELATVEEEITWLEKNIHMLSLSLYREKKRTQEQEFKQLRDPHSQHEHKTRKQSLRKQQNRAKFTGYELQNYDTQKRRSSVGSSGDIRYSKLRVSVLGINENENERDIIAYSRRKNRKNLDENPNKLSEELMKCLIGIFLEMNRPFLDSEDGLDIVSKQSISCMNSRSFISKTTFNCTAPMFFFNDSGSNSDPYSTLLDFDGAIRDIGPYKNFVQITRNTMDHTRISECSAAIGKLRVLMQKLCGVDLNMLTYKQKLAFWINIYNACIMHAFLQHGLPSTQEKLLVLMNKAAINVGGIVLNALGIEHFILRHPSNSNHGREDEKEMLLRHTYGLGFPEPNVTFALCRGSWSSPALRVYTAEDIVNELAKARLEYLEASVGVISKKKITVPKLLQWHIKDFADDMESLIEWIYSQLPQSGSLKRLIMECLNGETKSTPAKMIEIQPFVYEFRYLLPS